MKRKFAVLAVLGALAALALPASSMGGMWPASAKFEISGAGTIGTALGSCKLGKIIGQISSKSEAPTTVSIPPVTSCTTGTTLTLNNDGSGWSFGFSAPVVSLGQLAGEATVMRFSSLPGCKLTGLMTLRGIWSNGILKNQSAYHADSAAPLTWANDGATCALAGQSEAVSYSDLTVSGQSKTPVAHQVNNLTQPGATVIIGDL
ncbi:MAG TPA: hypothetical protein VGI73_05135 [Solirubrobacterales bacterium]|jgi:hypothetical protein